MVPRGSASSACPELLGSLQHLGDFGFPTTEELYTLALESNRKFQLPGGGTAPGEQAGKLGLGDTSDFSWSQVKVRLGAPL